MAERVLNSRFLGSPVNERPRAEGWTCTKPAVGSAGKVWCRTTELPVATDATFTLVVRVTFGTLPGTLLTNAATVSYTTADPDPSNNVAVATTTVAGLLLPGAAHP